MTRKGRMRQVGLPSLTHGTETYSDILGDLLHTMRVSEVCCCGEKSGHQGWIQCLVDEGRRKGANEGHP